jgi:hypothetical protein
MARFTPAELPPGTRVAVDGTPGTVVYVRCGPPNFDFVTAVSVRLDTVKRTGYTGTVVSAEAVELLD